ncbi:hypothetical protein MB14_13005 [Roseivirga ehrenbergii]|uniref:DUF695 domain-containing protein n=1 Tax=Roseivirga ehrenbergii (strain DSM 102268 / JCM 13514 / KCTC 12282 / NCIMB 14502 / KMM 6017) TaxID=279360 RepID=A0A150XST2_ROSEK|nr:hypothetical protein MB14_13005 [Roseivirga ehrenbergii]
MIGRYYENEFPVIVKFVDEIPNDSIIKKSPVLTVISWKYEGETNNGMPPHEINEKMIDLEEAIENIKSSFKKYQHAYSRTGNNLKELVYYSASQDDFMASLNKTLTKHERYPIEIDFYEDPEWREFKKLIEDFKKD